MDNVAILGTGLIGGSIAGGLRRALTDVRVVGYDRNPEVAAAALDAGALTITKDSPGDAVSGAELVVLAAPVEEIPSLCDLIAEAVPADAIVTDVGSAKGPVVARGEAIFGSRFVGGHPMAGSERHGIWAADPRLFEGAWWILCPTRGTSSEAYSQVTQMVTTLGARPVAIDAAVHDSLVARISHIPQVAASALVDLVVTAGDTEALLGLAAGGFRDVTRIAASSPELWVGILRANRQAVLESLAGLTGRLADVAEMIELDRWDDLTAFLGRARRARSEMFRSPDYGGEPIALAMVAPNRPGVLMEVTTAAGELGANIEALHTSPAGAGAAGRIDLVVAGRDRAAALAVALEKLGYHVVPGDESI